MFLFFTFFSREATRSLEECKITLSSTESSQRKEKIKNRFFGSFCSPEFINRVSVSNALADVGHIIFFQVFACYAFVIMSVCTQMLKFLKLENKKYTHKYILCSEMKWVSTFEHFLLSLIFPWWSKNLHSFEVSACQKSRSFVLWYSSLLKENA